MKNNFNTSRCTDNGHDVNIRFVYAMRCIDKGYNSSSIFCSLMNLPKPYSKFHKINKILLDSVENVAQQTMVTAVKEAVECNDGFTDISVALDGTWQKRGHTSLHGVVAATSVDTGKVIDIEILTKY